MDANILLELRREWKTGDRAACRIHAKQIVSDHRAELIGYEKFTRDDLVVEVDEARKAKDHLRVLEIECWLLSEYEPQQIFAVWGYTQADVLAAAAETLNRAQRRAK